MISLNLIVIRSENLAESVRWYSETFDLKFVTEKHDNAILHYSAELSAGLLEIYPSGKTVSKITFGFAVTKKDFENTTSTVNYKTIGENLALIKDVYGNS